MDEWRVDTDIGLAGQDRWAHLLVLGSAVALNEVETAAKIRQWSGGPGLEPRPQPPHPWLQPQSHLFANSPQAAGTLSCLNS